VETGLKNAQDKIQNLLFKKKKKYFTKNVYLLPSSGFGYILLTTKVQYKPME